MAGLDDVLREFGLAPPAPTVDVPTGQRLYAPQSEPDVGATQSFAVISGTPLDQRLGFQVGSVVVDNNTSTYLNIPDATKDGTGRYVPPGSGAAMPILGHISRARINWTAPPGKNQPSFVAGESAQVIFFASPMPPGLGLASPSSATMPWISPNRLPVNINANVNGTQILVPALAGQIVYVFYLSVAFLAAATADLTFQDTTAVGFGAWTAGVPINTYQFAQMDFRGTQLPAGRGIQVTTTAAVNIRGSLTYSQA